MKTKSLHFSKNAAHRAAIKANKRLNEKSGSSSAWARLDYSVRNSGRVFRQWETFLRTGGKG
jgi:hypothetical protein